MGHRLKEDDLKQKKLTIIGQEVKAELQYQEEYSCPYCLFTGKMSSFFMVNEEGYVRKRYKCPDCGQVMMASTLTMKRTVEEYAKWLYDSCKMSANSSNPTFKRVSWEKLKAKLKASGISQRFWNAWKQAKGLGIDEMYEAYQKAEQEGYRPPITNVKRSDVEENVL